MSIRRALLASLLFLLTALPVRAEVLEVVTTTPDLADAVRGVGGSRVHVQSLCLGYQNPHQVETRPSYLRTLAQADAFLQTGLDLEVAWAPELLRSSRNSRIMPGGAGFCDASSGIRILEVPRGQVDRTMGDVHPLGNPHYTMDPVNMKIVARNVTAFLKRLDPGGAATYDAGYRNYWASLDAADKRWKAQLAPFRGAPIVTYHSTWPYFAAHFGLQVVGHIEPQAGISPSPAHLNRLSETMKQRGVRVIISETWFPESIAQSVSRQTGARLLKLPVLPGGVQGRDTYVEMMDYVVGQIAGGLR
jgi:ABC-type Zn uptake system ZnuABC Zn-binding protein ZnuA